MESSLIFTVVDIFILECFRNGFSVWFSVFKKAHYKLLLFSMRSKNKISVFVKLYAYEFSPRFRFKWKKSGNITALSRHL